MTFYDVVSERVNVIAARARSEEREIEICVKFPACDRGRS
jgi:hypothetical protein